MTFNRIAIYGSRRQESFKDKLSAFFEFMEEAGFRLYIHSGFYDYLESEGIAPAGGVPSVHIPPDVSLVISIGGDGTFLRAARWVGEKEIPIMGVNTGHLGYLSACGLEEAPTVLTEICRGEVTIEPRMLLKVECPDLPKDIWPYALNEVTVRRNEDSSVITVGARVNGDMLADYVADGLILSTPTGSTAYNLSAGGPIIAPTINCMAITPIAPHALTLRPLVVGGNAVVSLNVSSRSSLFRLSLDDRSFNMKVGRELTVSRAGFSVMLIRRPDVNFATLLRDKLLWNAR